MARAALSEAFHEARPAGLAACGKPPAAVDPAAFIAAMSAAATGVGVVTTAGCAGAFGLTVSAIASVSAEPPMLLVCINRQSPALAAIRRNAVFCLNLLTPAQDAVADCFAGRACGAGAAYDFGCADWSVATTGAAVLEGAAASFDCAVERGIDAGTHTVLIGLVLAAVAGDAEALVHSRRRYCVPNPLIGPHSLLKRSGA